MARYITAAIKIKVIQCLLVIKIANIFSGFGLISALLMISFAASPAIANVLKPIIMPGLVLGENTGPIATANPELEPLGSPYATYYNNPDDYRDNIQDLATVNTSTQKKVFIATYATGFPNGPNVVPIYYDVMATQWGHDVYVNNNETRIRRLPQEGTSSIQEIDNNLYYNSLDAIGGGIQMFRRNEDGSWDFEQASNGEHSRATFARVNSSTENTEVFIDMDKTTDGRYPSGRLRHRYPGIAVSIDNGESFTQYLQPLSDNNDDEVGGSITEIFEFKGNVYAVNSNLPPTSFGVRDGEPQATFLMKYDPEYSAGFRSEARLRSDVFPESLSNYSWALEEAEVIIDSTGEEVLIARAGKLYASTDLTSSTTEVIFEIENNESYVSDVLDIYKTDENTVMFLSHPHNGTQKVYRTNGETVEEILELYSTAGEFSALAVLDNNIYLATRSPDESLFMTSLDFDTGPGSNTAIGDCDGISDGSQVPPGYADPLDNDGNNLVNADCDGSQVDLVVGVDDGRDIIYDLGYYWNGDSWQSFTLEPSGNGSRINSAWLREGGFAQIPQTQLTTPGYILNFVCRWNGFGYDCPNVWMMQTIE
jgi:hypothetical protein